MRVFVGPESGFAFSWGSSKPINDFVIRNGHFQDDGMLVHDMYLYEVKKPAESKGEWDLYKKIATIPGAEAYKRPNGNECPAVKG